MLVLSRKLQQQIKIGDQITVTILRVKGNTVRVGIQAPRDLRVIRGELPKNGETAGSAALPEGGAVIAIADADTGEMADSPDEAAESQAGQIGERHATPLPSPAHLPLRRIRQRHGRGPLQQVVAACAALAK